MDGLLHVARIHGGYAVILDDGAQLADADLIPGNILASFAREQEAKRYAQWLTVLRAGYHGAKLAHL